MDNIHLREYQTFDQTPNFLVKSWIIDSISKIIQEAIFSLLSKYYIIHNEAQEIRYKLEPLQKEHYLT